MIGALLSFPIIAVFLALLYFFILEKKLKKRESKRRAIANERK